MKEGGKFEGYLPIIQGDNAGPHEDAKFKNYVNKECEEKGWLWEPQGPQMPHMNVLDLAVFPAMSRRHSHLCRAKNGMKVLKEDDIWDCAQTVWEELPSSKIANAFVHAKRIAEKIVASKGDNGFLAGIKGQLSAGVRNDFMETDFGNKRRDGIKMEFERENKNESTRGIWICPELKAKEKTGTKILFLDTEAISGLNNDNKFYSENFIYLLLFFISSCIIHNTDTDINNEGLSEIKFLENLGEAFNLKVN